MTSELKYVLTTTIILAPLEKYMITQKPKGFKQTKEQINSSCLDI